MRLKIRCDGKSEKFCKIFWKLNNVEQQQLRDNATPTLLVLFSCSTRLSVPCAVCAADFTAPLVARGQGPAVSRSSPTSCEVCTRPETAANRPGSKPDNGLG